MVLKGEIRVNNIIIATINKEDITIFGDALHQGYAYVRDTLRNETITRNYISCASQIDKPPFNFNIRELNREGLELEVHLNIK